MKVLSNVRGLIEKKYGTYDTTSVQSYLGNSKGHLFVNFALEDKMVNDILREYENSSLRQKEKLKAEYDSRVKALIDNKEFCVKNIGKHTVLPSVEISKSKTPGYLVGMFGKNQLEFEKFGESLYIPKEYFDGIRMIQRIEVRKDNKRVSGLWYVPKMSNFNFYVLTRQKDINDKYYVEEVNIEFLNESLKVNSFNLNEDEYLNLIKNLREI